MGELLSKINSPDDLKKLPQRRLPALAEEIRRFLVNTLSATGGHLAPNLGIVELTIALHRVFRSPQDKIVWDVGHQCYVHKILTGRREQFATIRQLGGLSGYPRPCESPHDVFGTGHGSTSISAALGMATARDLAGQSYHVVAVIGDGALTGGMAFEALNHAGALGTDLIVVLNDNGMSIARNVGAMARYLAHLRTHPQYLRAKELFERITRRYDRLGVAERMLQLLDRFKDSAKQLFLAGMVFEELGLRYIGPVDGHNVDELIDILQGVKNMRGPVLVHVLTQKGKGYAPAEHDAEVWHGTPAFDAETGTVPRGDGARTFTEVFGDAIVELAERYPRLVAVTAAMIYGTGLRQMQRRFPRRVFDVGMAEQHAVTFAAGLAAQGWRPVCAIYSTFLQRGYDQVLHDVCLQNLPVVFCLDRGGVVGADGATHQGLFDLSYLRHIPNIVVAAPRNETEFRDLLRTAVEHNGPFAIRYPRAQGEGAPCNAQMRILPIGRGVCLRPGGDCTVCAVGVSAREALDAAELLAREGIAVEVLDPRFIKPLDAELIVDSVQRTGALVTVEENVLQGGFGSAVLELLQERGLSNVAVRRLGVPDMFVDHGPRDAVLHELGLDAEGIANAVREVLVRKRAAPLDFAAGSGAS